MDNLDNDPACTEYLAKIFSNSDSGVVVKGMLIYQTNIFQNILPKNKISSKINQGARDVNLPFYQIGHPFLPLMKKTIGNDIFVDIIGPFLYSDLIRQINGPKT